jgi:hypothetical protein
MKYKNLISINDMYFLIKVSKFFPTWIALCSFIFYKIVLLLIFSVTVQQIIKCIKGLKLKYEIVLIWLRLRFSDAHFWTL